jgi:hypothetical protein
MSRQSSDAKWYDKRFPYSSQSSEKRKLTGNVGKENRGLPMSVVTRRYVACGRYGEYWLRSLHNSEAKVKQ